VILLVFVLKASFAIRLLRIAVVGVHGSRQWLCLVKGQEVSVLTESLQLGEVEDVSDSLLCECLLLTEANPGQSDLVDALVLVDDGGLLLDLLLGDGLVPSDDVDARDFALFDVLLDNGRVHLFLGKNLLCGHPLARPDHMGVLVCVGVRLRLDTRLLMLAQFLSLGFACGLLPLLLRILLRLEESILIGGLFELALFQGVLPLLLQLLLSGRGSFGAEVLKFLFLFCKHHLSSLVFEKGLHLCGLQAADVADQGPMANGRSQDVVIANRGTRHHAEVR
jgi:hypothetical protein